jgi:hypothetical protein
MISTLLAGLSLLLFSGLANTYFSYLLLDKNQTPPSENNL